MNYDKLEDKALEMALKAKPGMLKHQGKLYTLVFNQGTWLYDVYEDGFYYINLNTKSISNAKKMLIEWLNN